MPDDRQLHRADGDRAEGHSNRAAIQLITADLEPGDTFIDVGANCGLFTVFAARKVGPLGKVLAIEPIHEMVRRLRFNVAANGFGNVVVVDTAVGDGPGEIEIFVDDKRYGHASATIHDGVSHKVKMQTLLDACETAGLSTVGALKIDIEGYEDRALVPFFASAPRSLWPRRIFIEIAQRANWEIDCIEKLTSLGYSRLWNSDGDVLLEKSSYA